MKKLYEWLFLLIVKIAYALYQIEGVNACLLIAPAKLLPTILRRYGASFVSKPQSSNHLARRHGGAEKCDPAKLRVSA